MSSIINPRFQMLQEMKLELHQILSIQHFLVKNQFKKILHASSEEPQYDFNDFKNLNLKKINSNKPSFCT